MKNTNDFYEVMGRLADAKQLWRNASRSTGGAGILMRRLYLSFTSEPSVADEIDWDDIACQCERHAQDAK